MTAQLDLFAPRAPAPRDYSRLFTPPRPYRQGDVARLWHGMHVLTERTAWYFWDAANKVWTCIDPFDQYGINDRDEPPVVNEYGRLA